jgi:hypothetical protein
MTCACLPRWDPAYPNPNPFLPCRPQLLSNNFNFLFAMLNGFVVGYSSIPVYWQWLNRWGGGAAWSGAAPYPQLPHAVRRRLRGSSADGLLLTSLLGIARPAARAAEVS